MDRVGGAERQGAGPWSLAGRGPELIWAPPLLEPLSSQRPALAAVSPALCGWVCWPLWPEG